MEVLSTRGQDLGHYRVGVDLVALRNATLFLAFAGFEVSGHGLQTESQPLLWSPGPQQW